VLALNLEEPPCLVFGEWMEHVLCGTCAQSHTMKILSLPKMICRSVLETQSVRICKCNAFRLALSALEVALW